MSKELTQGTSKQVSRPMFEQWAIKAREAFIRVAGEEKWNREIIFALQDLRKNESLQKCSPESIQNAVVNIALTGASLNPVLHQAWLVPRDGKCCLDFSYRGLAKIAMDEGVVKNITAQVVYDWDEFDYEQGSDPYIHYKMNMNPPIDMDVLVKNPSKIWEFVKCAYSQATLEGGLTDFVILPKWKLWKTYMSAKGRDNPKMPWQTSPDEMMRKTVIKYHSKTLQQSGGSEKLATAVSHLNEHEGLIEDAIDTTPQKVSETVQPAEVKKPEKKAEKKKEPEKSKKQNGLPSLCNQNPMDCEFSSFIYKDDQQIILCKKLGDKECPCTQAK